MCARFLGQINVGRQEVALVLRVDKDKGYIDLSKRRVSPEDIDAIEERFNKSKSVHSIMRSLFLREERRKLFYSYDVERVQGASCPRPCLSRRRDYCGGAQAAGRSAWASPRERVPVFAVHVPQPRQRAQP